MTHANHTEKPFRASRVLWLGTFATSALMPAIVSAAVAIDVRGKAHLLASAECNTDRNACTARGSLRDELGDPLANRIIQVRPENEAAPIGQGAVSFDGCSPESATATTEQRLSKPTDRASVATNGAGDFCVRITSSEPINGAMQVDYAGDAMADSASTRLDLRAERSPTNIEWLNPRRRLELDAPIVLLDLQLRETDQPLTQQSLSIAVFDQQSAHELLRATQTTDAAGVAHFRLRENQLGNVGSGRLEAVFEGDAKLAPAKRNWPIFRVCSVQVQPKQFERQLTAGASTDLSVAAKTRCDRSVPGMVEFRVQGQLRHRALVENDQATYRFSTEQYSPGPITVSARYVAPSEGWVPGQDARFSILLAPASTRVSLFWLVASVGLAVWLTIKWGHGAIQPLLRHQPDRNTQNATSMDRTPPEPGKSGWYGVVIDAHTGLPISDARLHIEHPGFAERQLGATAISSDTGEFAFPSLDVHDLSRLRVEARHYNDGDWPLPSQGRLTIRLQTTRRAILHAFVTWVESSSTRRGPHAEPTPAEVRLGTTREQAPAVVEWAGNVEKAAFGPATPDRDAKALLSGPSQGSRVGRQL